MNTLTLNTETSRDGRLTCAVDAEPIATADSRAVAVQIVIPVYNEQRALAASVRQLHDHLVQSFNFAFEIVIADNASTDDTHRIALELAHAIPEVCVLRLERKGRGRALRAAWSDSQAEVVAYMDVDLSTDLVELEKLLLPLLEGRADIAIGTRLAPGAQVTRGVKRELISRSYNRLLRALLGVGFSDAQCGFKAARRETLPLLLAEVEDDNWFFDTELLYRAERRGLEIHEVPVRWVDDPDSRVAIVATARADLQGIRRLRVERRRRDAAAAHSEQCAERYARARDDDRTLPSLSARPVAGLGGLLGLAGVEKHDRSRAARG